MKLISRTSERTLARKHNEPHYQPWGQWEVCEGTEQLTASELRKLIREWHEDETVWATSTEHFMVRGPYCREEYRIVPDEFNPADMWV